jgi:hypothetical protein
MELLTNSGRDNNKSNCHFKRRGWATAHFQATNDFINGGSMLWEVGDFSEARRDERVSGHLITDEFHLTQLCNKVHVDRGWND